MTRSERDAAPFLCPATLRPPLTTVCMASSASERIGRGCCWWWCRRAATVFEPSGEVCESRWAVREGTVVVFVSRVYDQRDVSGENAR